VAVSSTLKFGAEGTLLRVIEIGRRLFPDGCNLEGRRCLNQPMDCWSRACLTALQNLGRNVEYLTEQPVAWLLVHWSLF
jgi:hypothetical protein